MPTPPPGFDPAAEFDNVSKDLHTRVPRSSHRAGPHELNSVLALGVLTLYLSNKKGWKPPNAEKLAAKYTEGADRFRDAVSEIERAGFLVRYRLQGERGVWKTHTVVSAEPESLVPIREWADKLKIAQDAAAAARKAAGKSGSGRRGQVAQPVDEQPAPPTADPVTSPDETFSQVGPDGGDRVPVHRDSGDRVPVQGDLRTQESISRKQEETPPSVTEGTAAPAAAPTQAVTGGIDSLTAEERTNLIEAVDQAAQARAGAAGWSRSQVADAARIAIEAGFAAELVARQVIRLAGDKPTGNGNDGTEYPTRLVHFLRDMARRAVTAAAPVSPATAPPGPFTYIDVDRPRCPVHPGHPADNCAPHKVDAMIAAKEAEEALEVAAPGPMPATGADARRLAAEAIAAARAKRGAGSPPAPLRRHQPRPGGNNLGGLLGAFSIPAEDLDAAAADLAEQGDTDPYEGEYARIGQDAHAV
jgi:hypothetical protein